MREIHFTSIQSQTFEKTMASGLSIFAAFAIIQLAGSEDLIGPALFALCRLSIALPFLLFQIACTTLGVPQRHKALFVGKRPDISYCASPPNAKSPLGMIFRT